MAAATVFDTAVLVRRIVHELLEAHPADVDAIYLRNRDERAVAGGDDHVDVIGVVFAVFGLVVVSAFATDEEAENAVHHLAELTWGCVFYKEKRRLLPSLLQKAVTPSTENNHPGKKHVVTPAKRLSLPQNLGCSLDGFAGRVPKCVVEDTTPEAFRKYLRGVRAAKTAEKYYRCAKILVKLMRYNGYTTFADIQPSLLSDLVSTLVKQGKSPSTIRVEVYAAKKYLDWVESRGIQVAKQHKVDLPKREILMREVLPPEQFTNYLRAADLELEEPLRTAVMLLPCCGLRASEMVSLKLEHIHRARVRLKNGKMKTTLFLRVLGKGKRERHVPLMEEGVEILTGYLAGWRRRQPGPWLFPNTARKSTKGKNPISDRHLRGSLQKLREPLGLEFTPHTMRRTYITTLHRKGVALATIAKIAGHANVQTTIEHYISIEPTDAVRAVHDAGSAIND